MEEIRDIVGDYGLDKDTLRALLIFLNDRGLINYFAQRNALNNLAILEPQWLVDGITTLIRDDDLHAAPTMETIEGERGWKKYRKTGVIAQDVALEAWNSDERFRSEQITDFLTEFMLQMRLMAETKINRSKTFLIPKPGVLTGDEIKKPKMLNCCIDFSGRFGGVLCP